MRQALSNSPTGSAILVVEDDLAIVQALMEALEPSNHRLTVAPSGNSARVAMAFVQPDLIVLDLSQPDVDGLVLCAAFKAATDAAMLVLCGATQQRDAIIALKLGADDFVSKPFNIDEVEARVGALLRRRARSLVAGPMVSPRAAGVLQYRSLKAS